MNRPWKQTLVAIPGIGVSLMPKLACPLCWPAYAGLLSSVGLGFLISAKYLLPLTLVFLALVLTSLGFRARKRHGYGPFVLGSIAALGVTAAKFKWESGAALYCAIALLIIASVWNAWPIGQAETVPCSPCETAGEH